MWCGLSSQRALEPHSPPGATRFSPLQDQKILLSIYNISMSLREVAAGTLRGSEELAVWKVARNTDTVLRENCRKISKVRVLPLPSLPSVSQLPSMLAAGLLRALLAAHGESPQQPRGLMVCTGGCWLGSGVWL